MNWFDDQLRSRREADDRDLTEAVESIAGAIMGTRLSEAFDNRETAHNAIEEILRFYHLKSGGEEESLPPEIQSLEQQIEYCMRPQGILHRTVKLEDGWQKDAFGPMLGTLKEDGRAVALIPGRFSGYSYLDLATGKRVRIGRRTARLIDEEAVCFYKPLPMRELKITDLLAYMASQYSVSDIALYFGAMVVSTLLGMLSPLFTKWLFGSVLASGAPRVLIALACFMVSFSLCNMLFGAFRSLVQNRISAKQSIAVEAAVMSRVLSLPATFFRAYSAGELTQRAQYVQNLCSTLFDTIATTAFTSVFSLVYVGQIFAFAPALVAPSLIVILATFVLSVVTTLVQTRITKEEMTLSSKTSGMTYSMITGIQKIKLAGAEKRMFSRWAKSYSKEAKLMYNPPVLLKLSGTVTMAVGLIGSLVMYSFALKSGVGVSDYYAFTTAYAMVSGAFGSLSSVAGAAANIKPILEMARPILEAKPEFEPGKKNVERLRGGIELSHISFKYNEDQPNIIDDLSLKIRPGEYLAIVGSTGCGKSTLLRLLLGFEKPQKGTIYYDRYDLTRVDVQSLRRKIGVVMQDARLFSGDIFSNITISAPEMTLDGAWEAAELAQVAEDIRKMPMGMNTLISEGQGGISGGQRQRLMIARALASKPKILMFDEATSALDNITQKKVCEAIDALKCTRIVIAHRLSTIRRCDRIIVLDKGRIVEDGTYEQLIEKNGFFADLVERQRLDKES